MKKFRKIWNEELNEFVIRTKGMNRKDALSFFRQRYPELSQEISETAFYNQRSRLGAADTSRNHHTRKQRPLYSEHVKKGYVRIKIAQPNVWVAKSKWVYMETHPWEDFSERSNYIFLDGNDRNFSPENIERVPLKLMGIFCNFGACVKGKPELTRLNVLRAKLKYLENNRLLEIGDAVLLENGHILSKHKARNYRRSYYKENAEKIRAKTREKYWANHEKALEYQREYRKRKNHN